MITERMRNVTTLERWLVVVVVVVSTKHGKGCGVEGNTHSMFPPSPGHRAIPVRDIEFEVILPIIIILPTLSFAMFSFVLFVGINENN